MLMRGKYHDDSWLEHKTELVYDMSRVE